LASAIDAHGDDLHCNSRLLTFSQHEERQRQQIETLTAGLQKVSGQLEVSKLLSKRWSLISKIRESEVLGNNR
jgi:hypothetical protein